MKYILVVSNDYLPRINELVDKLKADGNKVERVLPITGIITINTKNNIESLKIEGISTIEYEKTVRI